MNLLSLNVQGTWVVGKASWCRNLRREHEVNFLLIQESLCSSIEDKLVESFWGK